MLELVFFKGVGGDFEMEWKGFELGFGSITYSWRGGSHHHDNRSVGNLYTTRLDRKLGTRDILNRHTHPRYSHCL